MTSDQKAVNWFVEVVAQWRSKGGQIPAISLTAYAGETTQQQVFTAGFQLYVAKPADPFKLVTAIAALIERG